MLTATVVGNVWSTRRLAEIPNGAFLEVEAEGTGSRLVAFDVLGSGVGERVLVAQGSVAAAWFPGEPPPIDALIIGSIDEPASGGSGPSRSGVSTASGVPPRASTAAAPATESWEPTGQRGVSGGSSPQASRSKKGKTHG
jgi:ethanolamine utilization protein EutN